MRLSEIRTAIAEVIRAAQPKLSVYDTVPGVPQVPAVVVVPSPNPTAAFDLTMGPTSTRWFLDIYILVPYTEQDSGQHRLDALLDPATPNSVVALLRNADTLNGAVDDSKVTGIKNYGGKFESASIQHIGAVVSLEVLTC